VTGVDAFACDDVYEQEDWTAGIATTRGSDAGREHAGVGELGLQATPSHEDGPGASCSPRPSMLCCGWFFCVGLCSLGRTLADAHDAAGTNLKSPLLFGQEEAASAKEEKDSKRRRTTDASAQVKAAGGSTVEQANERESRRRDSKEERREHREHKKESAKEEKKESREERKVRKEREAARKAAKDSKREGGSKDKEKVGGGKEGASSNREVGSSKSRGDSHRERKTMDEEEVGGASSKIVRASPRHRESKQSAVVVSGSSAGDKRRPPALATVEATSKEAGSRGVKEGKQLMDYSSREDKGKGKAPMYEEELAEYESLSKAQRLPLHKEIATDVPDLKRLQMLLELAVEAETEAVRKHLGSRGSAVAKMFEEATSQFIVESEGITISKLKVFVRQRSRPTDKEFN
jgi:hypothetical protein